MDAAAELVREFGLLGAVVISLIFALGGVLPAIIFDRIRRNQTQNKIDLLEAKFTSEIKTNSLNVETEKLRLEMEHDRHSHEMQMKLQNAILEIQQAAQKENEQKDKEITQLRLDNAHILEQNAQFETEAIERQKTIDMLLGELRTTNDKLLDVTERLGDYKNLAQRHEDLRHSVDQLQRDLTRAKESNADLIKQRKALEDRNAVLERENQRLQEQESKLTQELDVLRQEVARLAMRVGTLERENHNLLHVQEEKEGEPDLQAR